MASFVSNRSLLVKIMIIINNLLNIIFSKKHISEFRHKFFNSRYPFNRNSKNIFSNRDFARIQKCSKRNGDKNDPLIQFVGDVKEGIIRITFNGRTYWETIQNQYISNLIYNKIINYLCKIDYF